MERWAESPERGRGAREWRSRGQSLRPALGSMMCVVWVRAHAVAVSMQGWLVGSVDGRANDGTEMYQNIVSFDEPKDM